MPPSCGPPFASVRSNSLRRSRGVKGEAMWQEPKFDENQFAGRRTRTKAVRATKTADDWESTGISFQDFGGMHIYRRKTQDRRLPTPPWAVNDEQLCAVVLLFAEERLYIRDHTGTDQERMDRIAAESKR